MEALTIRRASDADLHEIVSIYNQAVEEHATADLEPTSVAERETWFDAHTSRRRPILVAVTADAKVVGWCTLSDHRPGRKALRETAEISYYVEREMRGKGVATAMLEYVLSRCADWEIRVLFAILLEDNQGSIRVLERHGFEQWGRLPEVARFGDRVLGQLYYGRVLRPASRSAQAHPTRK